jgi:hypothetical protein
VWATLALAAGAAVGRLRGTVTPSDAQLLEVRRALCSTGDARVDARTLLLHVTRPVHADRLCRCGAWRFSPALLDDSSVQRLREATTAACCS